MIDRRPPPHTAWIDYIATMDEVARAEFVKALDADDDEFLNSWRFIARREQLPPPGDWSVWINLAGRGAGKTRSGSEWMIAAHKSGQCNNSALVGSTVGDVRAHMLEGESGLLRVAPNDFMPEHKPSLRKLIWPNGSTSHTYSAEDPERLRGPNHDRAWCDELAAWQYLEETWDMLEMTLRVSDNPQIYVSTTPKPRLMLRELITKVGTVMTRGSTFDNAKNLSPKFLARIEEHYAGTRLGRQELYAEMLDEAEGALFERDVIDQARIKPDDLPEITNEVVAIDPAATDTEQSSETGILHVGVDQRNHGYVLTDLSGRYSPEQWARKALLIYQERKCNCIVAERNNGGDMVKFTIDQTAKEMHRKGELESATVPVKIVFASKGKYARAEPISAMCEQGRIHHVGHFKQLEDQLCTWEPDSKYRSPDRLDALVWGFTHLLLINIDGVTVAPWSMPQESYWKMAG